ncbi:hypothetical protein PIROE2DRAFT_4012 [Piromyces sp. E2]|nr:hypothetical protein PIROE2DRAFT_4012 [Piromyces sp. E2]|eukprot:OUM68272.1 hypothetical protein PIROE2DRAFT_4012 [Piromyces sp. E2]
MEKYYSWDNVNADSWDEEALFKRNDVYDSFKNNLSNAGDKISNAAGDVGGKISDAASSAGNTISNQWDNAGDTISGAWNSTKAQIDEAKETLETVKKIFSYIPYILLLLFLIFVAFIVYLIYLCIKHHKKSNRQMKQIDDLTLAINNLNAVLGKNDDVRIAIDGKKSEQEELLPEDERLPNIPTYDLAEKPITKDI